MGEVLHFYFRLTPTLMYHKPIFLSCMLSCSGISDSERCHGLYNLPISPVQGVFLEARILEEAVISYSRGSSQSRDQRVSCISRWTLYHCTTWEAQSCSLRYIRIPEIYSVVAIRLHKISQNNFKWKYSSVPISTQQLQTAYFTHSNNCVATKKWAFLVAGGKGSSCQYRRCRLNPWVRRIPWRRKWQPTLVFLPGKSHGQRNLVGCSPWGRRESDTT